MMLSFSLVVLATFIFFCMQVLDIYEDDVNRDMERSKSNPAYNSISETQKQVEDYYKKSTAAKRQFKNQKQYWPVYQQLNSMMPPGTYFKEVLIEENNALIRGVSENRDAVVALKDALEKSDNFEKVESPISNYVQDQNAEFEFKFIIKNSKQ